jgi:Polyketide cyclase / dehydrase and lipid transport
MSIEVSATAHSNAEPHRVFVLLKDGSTWPRWSMFRAFELERAGSPDPFGVGAVRKFVSSTRRAREEVIELVPDRRLSYILLSGLPLKNYRADVALDGDPTGGTHIHWTAHFEVDNAATRWFWKLVMQYVLATTTSRLAEGAQDASIVTAAETNLTSGSGHPKLRGFGKTVGTRACRVIHRAQHRSNLAPPLRAR